MTRMLIQNAAEHRIEMLLAFSGRHLMDQDEGWLLERYQQSITVAAAMLFGDDEFRFLPISYDDILCVAGPTPIADAHRSVFAQDPSTEPYEDAERSEEHTSELQSLMRISYAVFCLKKKITNNKTHTINITTLSKTTRTY